MSSAAEKVSIRIWLNGEEYASRYWSQVPRVGEFLILNSHVHKDVLRAAYKIKSVAWDQTDDRRQIATIEFEPNGAPRP